MKWWAFAIIVLGPIHSDARSVDVNLEVLSYINYDSPENKHTSFIENEAEIVLTVYFRSSSRSIDHEYFEFRASSAPCRVTKLNK